MRFYLSLLFAFLLVSSAIPLKAQTITLEKKTILDNKVEILLPKGFEPLEEEILKFKYPSERRPTLVLSDYEAKTNIAFNHTANKATQSDLEEGKNQMLASFKKSFPTAEWLSHGVKEVNGRLVGYLEVVTPAIDQKIYNLLFFTDLDGRILMGTFNCLEKERANWQASAHQILNSLTLTK